MISSFDQKLVKQLAQKYSTLDYSKELGELLMLIYPSKDFSEWKKYKLHELINEVIIKQYKGEEVLKYCLFEHFYNQKVVAAFEINVNNSRADFLTINGCTKSFEIKSGLDNLSKLKKQADDYVRAFEFNHLVIDERHLEKVIDLVPSTFGIWSFINTERIIHRKATLNVRLNPEFQLRLLTKKELTTTFKTENLKISEILKEYSGSEINTLFKKVLKERYAKRWNFLLAYRESILPIDVQFFFKYNIKPNVIYQ